MQLVKIICSRVTSFKNEILEISNISMVLWWNENTKEISITTSFWYHLIKTAGSPNKKGIDSKCHTQKGKKEKRKEKKKKGM